jgi:non-ribosomal peptide synthetase component E (peptide arylation enzyme)
MQFATVLKPELAQRWRAAGEWREQSPFDILSAQASQHSDRVAFIDGDGRITYGELKDKVERCAAYLRTLGIERGDVVTVQLPNRIAFPIVFFALELIGAIANKVNPDFRIRELDYILRFSGSKAFICPTNFRLRRLGPPVARCDPGPDARGAFRRAHQRRMEPRARDRRNLAATG